MVVLAEVEVVILPVVKDLEILLQPLFHKVKMVVVEAEVVQPIQEAEAEVQVEQVILADQALAE